MNIENIFVPLQYLISKTHMTELEMMRWILGILDQDVDANAADELMRSL